MSSPSSQSVTEASLLANDIKTSSSSTLSDILNDEVAQTKLLASLVLFVITLLCGYLPVKILLNQNYIQYAMFAGGGVLMATAFCHLIPEAHDNFKLISAEFLSQQKNKQDHHHHHHHHHSHNHNNDNLLDSASSLRPATLLGTLATNSNNNSLLLVNNTFTNSTINEDNNNNVNITTTLQDDDNLLFSDSTVNNDNSGDNLFAFAGGLNIPYLEVTLCCGFFFMYLVEQLMVRFINNHSHNHHVPATAGNTCDHSGHTLVVPISDAINNSPSNNTRGRSDSAGDGGQLAAAGNNLNAGGTSVNLSSVSSVNTASSSARLRGNSSSLNSPAARGNEFYKFMRGLLIVSAFGAHSIFDGVAIGSQITVDKVWTIFLAISCHKLIIAAVVGLELYSATLESNLWTLVHLTIFSIMSPIGIVLVVIAQGTLHIDSNHPAMILLQSFATGTLLYIVFVEILQPKEDQVYEKNKFGKSLSLIAGFALMVTVLTIMDE